MKKRIEWLDVTKGIAIVLVVMGHVMVTYLNNNRFNDSVLYSFGVQLIYSFHMPLFMLASGILLGKQLIVSRIGVGKLVSYIVPYLFFSVFWWLYKYYISNSSGVGLQDLFLIFLYPISFMWFIYALLIMVSLQIIISIPNKRYQVIHCLVCVALLLIRPWLSEMCSWLRFDDLVISDVMKTYFYFVIGVYGAEKVLNLEKSQKKNMLMVFSLLILLVGNMLKYSYSVSSGITDIIIALSGCVFTMTFAITISQCKRLQYLGKTSLAIYLLQNLGIIISKKTLDIVLPNVEPFGSIELISGTVMGCIIPIILYYCTTKVWMLDFVFTPSKYFHKSR